MKKVLTACLFTLFLTSNVFAGPPSFLDYYKSKDAYDPYNEKEYDYSSESADFSPYLSEQGELLIISPQAYSADIKPFINWKKQLGYKVIYKEITQQDNSEEFIKETIKKSLEKNNTKFVILVGNEKQLKPAKGTLGNVKDKGSDPNYALLDSDIYPDVIISRFLVANKKELQSFIKKTIHYEKYPERNNNWYSENIGIASNEGRTGSIDYNDNGEKVTLPPTDDTYELLDFSKQIQKRDYVSSKIFLQTDDEGEHWVPQLTDAVNQGAGLLFYIGHGYSDGWKTSNFGNNQANKLTNKNKTPVILSVACLNGNYEYDKGTSFVESWLNTKEDNTGAVFMLAANTVQAWIAPLRGLRKMGEYISQNKYKTIGAITTNGKISMIRKKRKQVLETYENWHLFGDPTLVYRTKLPTEIEQNINSFIDLEEVMIESKELTLTALQGNKLLMRIINGKKELITQSKTKTPITLTITGVNKVPYIKTFFYDGEKYISN